MRRWSPWSIAAGLFTLGLALRVGFSTVDASDTDLWWHMASGRLFATEGRVRAADPFSYTSDRTWIQYSWLFDVIVYGVHQAGGLPGLMLLRLLLLGLSVVLMFLLVRSRLDEGEASTVAAWGGAALWAMLCQPYMLMRPHMFSWFLFQAFLMQLFRYRDGRLSNGAFLAWTVVLSVVWVNLHGAFTLQPVLLGLCAAADGARLALGWAPKDDRRWRVTAVASVLSMGVSLINPGGLAVVAYPFQHLLTGSYTETLSEEMPLQLFTANAPWVQILGVLDVIACVLLARSRCLFELSTLLLLTRVALHGNRHVTSLACFLLPVAAAELKPLLQRIPVGRARVAGWAACAAAAIWLGLVIPRLWPLDRCIREDAFPTDAIGFIRDNELPGRVFAPFEWGGYFIWHLPEHPVFMDGRSDVAYSKDVYLRYLTIVSGGRDWQGLLDRYGVNVLVLNRAFEQELGLFAKVAASKDWAPVFVDGASWVYLRRTPATADVLERLRRAPRIPSSATMDLTLGRDALAQGRTDVALQRLQQAVERAPYLAAAWVQLGVALIRAQRPDEARAAWERAVELDPDVPAAHFSLGVYWLAQGDRGRARSEFQAEIRAAPNTEVARQAEMQLRALGP